MTSKKHNVKAGGQNDTMRLRKFLMTLGMIFPLVGSAAADAKLRTNEYVMFLPDIAYQTEDGSVFAGIQGWVYEKEQRRGLTRLLALFLGIEMSRLTPQERRQLYDRTQLFRVDSERGKKLVLHDGGKNFFPLPTTGSNGRTSALLQVNLENTKESSELVFELHDSGTPAIADKARAFYAPPEGLSVISDIDDTIKESSVGDTKQLLVNTFLENFIAVDGMSSFYRAINKNGNVAFHYVSSSPIQLYPVLSDFMKQAGYPVGTMHLREATRWTDIIPGPKASRNHKMRSIERILDAYPKRSFVLIGDSSESDPAIYAEFLQKRPNQIAAVIIRDVKSDKKHSASTQEIDSRLWLTTSNVKEMQRFLEKLKPQ